MNISSGESVSQSTKIDLTKQSSTDESVQPSVDASIVSYSKAQLYKKWTAAVTRANQLKSSLVTVKKDVKVLRSEKRSAIRELELSKVGSSRTKKLVYDLSVCQNEKSKLEEDIVCLPSEKKRVATAHKNEISHWANERKFKF